MTTTDPRRPVITRMLDARYGGAVPAEPAMVTAIMDELDGNPGDYVAPRLVAAARDALTAAGVSHTSPAVASAARRVAEDAGPWNGFDMSGTKVAAYANRYRAETALERRQVAAISPAPRPASPAPAAHALALAGECSHGGHGWDGDTCDDITTPATCLVCGDDQPNASGPVAQQAPGAYAHSDCTDALAGDPTGDGFNGFDAGNPLHVALVASRQPQTGTCAYCEHTQLLAPLERINPATATLACRDLAACQARMAGEAEAAADDDMFGPQGDDTTSDLAYEQAVEAR